MQCVRPPLPCRHTRPLAHLVIKSLLCMFRLLFSTTTQCFKYGGNLIKVIFPPPVISVQGVSRCNNKPSDTLQQMLIDLACAQTDRGRNTKRALKTLHCRSWIIFCFLSVFCCLLVLHPSLFFAPGFLFFSQLTLSHL